MHPDKVDRNQLKKLTDLPNIGPAGAKDYQLLGYQDPQQLVGVSALHLYQQLCAVTGQQQTLVCWMCCYRSNIFWPVMHRKSGGLIRRSASSCWLDDIAVKALRSGT